MHFDHERIPERVVHARGAAAHGVFEANGEAEAITSAGFLQGGRAHAGVRALLDRRRLARFGRHRARRPRLRDEVLHDGGQLRSRRQQHPGVLHPGRHQVPRPDPRRQARARRRDPAGADRAHDVLGLRVADPRVAPHADVGDVGPRHPALVPDDGGLRRPHLPPRQRRGRDLAGEVPLEAGARRARPGVGGGAHAQRRRPRLPPPRPLQRHRGRRLPAVGARRAGDARHRRPVLRGHRPARRDEARARGAGAGADRSAPSRSTAARPTSSPRSSRSRSTSATSCGASRWSTTR